MSRLIDWDTISYSSGAGTSPGRSSWTGKAEILDYVAFVGCFVGFLGGVGRRSGGWVDSDSAPLTTALPLPGSANANANVAAAALGITLILGGYSYGSLLTSHLPAASVMLDRFAHAPGGTPEAKIWSQARDMAAQWDRSAGQHVGDGLARSPARPSGSDGFLLSMGGESPGSEGQRPSIESSGKRFDFVRSSFERPRTRLARREPRGGLQRQPSTAVRKSTASSIHDGGDNIIISQVCYLLISPLLPPISLFATMFAKLDDPSHTMHPSSRLSHNSLTPSERTLVSHPTLAVYGTRDFFCSHRKLGKWAEKLTQEPGSEFRSCEVVGAGHFWSEAGVEKELRGRIREWLHDVMDWRPG